MNHHRVGRLWGSRAGIDHVPNTFVKKTDDPFPLNESGPPGAYASVDLGKLMSWAWRVKEWQVDFSFTGSLHGLFIGDTEPTTRSWVAAGSVTLKRYRTPFSDEETGTIEVVHEHDLAVDAFGFSGSTTITEGFPGVITSPVLVQIGLSPHPVLYNPSTKMFGIPMGFSMPLIRSFPDAPFAAFGGPGIWSGNELTSIGSADVDGVEVPLVLKNSLSWAQHSDFSCSGGSMTFTPTKFHPYVNSIGLPVYDTATGAQLRDPFT